VCDWYRSVYGTLREYDQDFFPFLDHQTLGDRTRSLLKSRKATSAEVTAPSTGRALAIHPLVAGAAWIALPYDMLTHDNIRAEAGSELGLTIRLVMKNYFKYNIGRSQRLLQYWEEDKQRMIKLFGPDRYIMLAIDLREVLRAHGTLPYCPPGWVDPLGEDQFNIIKEWNLKKHHRLMIDNKFAAARRRLEEADRKESELQEFGIIMHMQNIMDTPVPKEMASLTPLTATAVNMADKPPVEQPPSSGSASELGDGATTPTTTSFKSPKLSKVQPAAIAAPSEEERRKPSPLKKDKPKDDEVMAGDLDLEVSDEDRRFVESSMSGSVDKMLDDKNSPVQSTLKPSLKKPEDTVKKLTGTVAKKTIFHGRPSEKRSRSGGSRP
jgi:hypothetical protein